VRAKTINDKMVLAAADAMRDELLAQGWVVKDGKGDYELERR